MIEAYDRVLEDDSGMTGEILECSAEKIINYNLPPEGNGRVTKRAVTVWDPLFVMMHGEPSGLDEALP